MQFKSPKITVNAASLTTKQLEIYANAIFLLPLSVNATATLPFGPVLKQRLTRSEHKLDSDNPFITDLPNNQGTRVALMGLGPELTAFELLTRAQARGRAQRFQAGAADRGLRWAQAVPG